MKQNSTERREISREAWWEKPPKDGEDETKVEWGYLIWYDDNSCEFSTEERPTDEEIESRTGSRTKGHGL